MTIISCVNGNANDYHEPVVGVNKWVSMEIGQEKRSDENIWYYIKVEDAIVYEKKNDSPLTFDNLHLWAADTKYPAAEGVRIRNWGYSTGGYADGTNSTVTKCKNV